MASRLKKKNSVDQADHDSSGTEYTRKQTTLYDAVAGRVGYEGFLTDQQPSKQRDTASTSQVPLPPEEILFRRRGAPVRFAEDDIYEADRHLQPHQKLPDSDLLKAIHAYIADYYDGTSKVNGNVDVRSFDETALLAFGILLEEASEHALGRTGDLAFVESSEATATLTDVAARGKLPKRLGREFVRPHLVSALAGGYRKKETPCHHWTEEICE
ncbi:hypothetical protein LTR35_010975 [Friedmanniomyces endolithicus]|uniref:Uncharacterized protein n=1 Tax=Friedmanniomyces endolithicus TaxID=329885 RepID=A0AAN6FHR5_9PEZI|nr:hypothetical protein LTR35_010975 [Friedmanniomyces endolithicus]KAK0278356.1 hypothetical protein LTS00_013806 [Friedmanniomyces endolithicus]KAK0316223.1 hypothetical protein LTR82_012251 [Friedmanniomyces endolithicus]KAK0992508.1 hypothetical protein LTR54_011379 [Friedmanniomyces endolithicus]